MALPTNLGGRPVLGWIMKVRKETGKVGMDAILPPITAPAYKLKKKYR